MVWLLMTSYACQKKHGNGLRFVILFFGLKESETRACYKQKLSMFGGQDPYVLASRTLLNLNDHFPNFRLS